MNLKALYKAHEFGILAAGEVAGVLSVGYFATKEGAEYRDVVVPDGSTWYQRGWIFVKGHKKTIIAEAVTIGLIGLYHRRAGQKIAALTLCANALQSQLDARKQAEEELFGKDGKEKIDKKAEEIQKDERWRHTYGLNADGDRIWRVHESYSDQWTTMTMSQLLNRQAETWRFLAGDGAIDYSRTLRTMGFSHKYRHGSDYGWSQEGGCVYGYVLIPYVNEKKVDELGDYIDVGYYFGPHSDFDDPGDNEYDDICLPEERK